MINVCFIQPHCALELHKCMQPVRLANKRVWETDKSHTYGETCCKCATNCGLHTRIRAVLVVLLLCAHILSVACVTEELKCKLLILFCSRGKPEKEMTWNCECEILFESCPTSHGSTENVCQDCHMEMSEILLL